MPDRVAAPEAAEAASALHRQPWLAKHLRGARSGFTEPSQLDAASPPAAAAAVPASPASSSRADAARKVLLAHLLVHTLEQGVFAALTIELIQSHRTGLGANGLLQALLALPLLLLALPLGALADRQSRSRMILGAEALRLGIYLGLSTYAGIWLADVKLAFMAAMALLLASASTLHAVCLPAVAPLLCDSRPALLRLNGLMELSKTVGYTLGPALFGWLLARGGLSLGGEVAATLVLVSGCLLFQALHTVRRLREAGQQVNLTQLTLMSHDRAACAKAPAQPRAPVWAVLNRVRSEALEGLRFVRGQPMLRDVFLAQSFFSLAFSSYMVAFVPHLSVDLALGSRGAGMVASTMGGGMFVGAISAAHVMRWLGQVWFCRLTSSTALLGISLVCTSHWTHSMALTVAGTALIGMGPMCWVVGTTTMRQVATPANLQGRVSSVNVLTLGIRVFGALCGAAVGAIWGIGPCLIVSLAFMVVFAATTWLSRSLGTVALSAA